MRRMTREEELETKMNALNVEISKVKVEQETSLEALRQEHGLSAIKRREEKEREDSRYRELEEKTTKEQTKHQLQLQTWKKKEEEEREKQQQLEVTLQEIRDRLVERVSIYIFVAALDHLISLSLSLPPPHRLSFPLSLLFFSFFSSFFLTKLFSFFFFILFFFIHRRRR